MSRSFHFERAKHSQIFFLLCVSIVSLLLYMQISIEMKGTHLQACIKGSDKIFIELFKC